MTSKCEWSKLKDLQLCHEGPTIINISTWFVKVPVSSTGKVSDSCIRDFGFNPRLHQKLINVLVDNKELLSGADAISWNSLSKKKKKKKEKVGAGVVHAKNIELSVCLDWWKLPNYFTIQLIFSTIYGSHCTFWYYSQVLLYYFS